MKVCEHTNEYTLFYIHPYNDLCCTTNMFVHEHVFTYICVGYHNSNGKSHSPRSILTAPIVVRIGTIGNSSGPVDTLNNHLKQAFGLQEVVRVSAQRKSKVRS